jgi:hypothetical protein
MGCASSVQVSELHDLVLSVQSRIEALEKSAEASKAVVAKLDVEVTTVRKDLEDAIREDDVEILSQCSEISEEYEKKSTTCDRRLGFNMW